MKSNKQYTPVIGLEVHAELSTQSKMFCGCKNDPFKADKPNVYTCPVCLGMPGALPIPNQKAIEWTIKLGLAVGCEINRFSKFDRKNYFYPDLAKGYQISQYDIPFCQKGIIETSQGQVGIRRIHLEEDTGKLIHDTVNGEAVSLIDFNRSGVPLVEIVTEPDIKNGQQAKEYGQNLRRIIRYLGISQCRMAEGEMRLEANISLQSPGQTELPEYKVELKNINSFKFLEQAINYEIKRQTQILDSGEIPSQETRGWDADRGISFSQRSKEEAADYRYFPDPDIPPLELTQEQIKTIQDSLPELPVTKTKRWQRQYQIEPKYAQQLAENRDTADWIETVFEQAVKNKIKPNEIANDVVNKKIEVEVGVSPQEVINQYQQLHQTETVAEDKLSSIVTQILADNPEAVAKYQSGKKQIIGFLIGQVKQQFEQKIDIQQIRTALMDKLKKK